MKYEITQEQYVAFLNTLTYPQQQSRTVAAPNSAAGTRAFSTNNRNGIEIMTPGVATALPAVYACDLNNNGIYNEPNDGQNIACNFLSWADLAAYLDWAALRPMTELEYEKACRGPAFPTPNEYAWGNITFTAATGINNPGANNETASNPEANVSAGNQAGVPGPMRVGNFGQGVNSREATGAAYYGIMEMSGNVWERVITVGNPQGRAFTDVNGDGTLDVDGNANQPTWPNASATGAGFRGGNWHGSYSYCRISDRRFASEAYSSRQNHHGGRGVRTAP